MNGRRIADDAWFTPEHDWQPGDYGLSHGALWAITPAGDPLKIDDRWGVEVHPDGTITVGPAHDGASHSIRVYGAHAWHGYLSAGVWSTCGDSQWQPA